MKFFLNCSPYAVNIYLSNQGAHADVDLLGCDIVQICRYVTTFRRNVLPPPSQPTHWYLPRSPCNITTHKTSTDIFTALRNSSLTQETPCSYGAQKFIAVTLLWPTTGLYQSISLFMLYIWHLNTT